MATLGKDTVAAALERLKLFLGLHTEGDIAEYLSITKQTMSNWKNRGSLDLGVIRKKIPNLSMDWLLDGVGEPHIGLPPGAQALIGLNKALADGITGKIPAPRVVAEPSLSYGKGIESEITHSLRIPIYYSVSAGMPTEAFNELKGHYKYDYLVNERTIGIEINIGEYSEYGFDEGDMLILDTARIPKSGNVVLVNDGRKLELYEYREQKDGVYLLPVRNDMDRTKKRKYDGSYDIFGVVLTKMKNYI